MSTVAPAETDPAVWAAPSYNHPSSWIPTWRAVSAKYMELRRRRGLLVAVLLLTLGILVLLNVIFLILHAADPHTYGPAGGLKRFQGFSIAFVDTFGISAIIVGAAAGSTDLSSGIFRQLVSTGRSRLAMFFSWLPAGLMVIVPITALTFAMEAFIGAFFAPSGRVTDIIVHGGANGARGISGIQVTTVSAVPTIHLMLVTGLWLMLQVVVAYVLGLGLGALTGSRSVTVVILIAMQLVVTPILSGITIPHLINLQRAFIGVAIAQLQPSGLTGFGGGGGGGGGGGNLLGIPPMPTFGVAIVITAWVVVALALGARRTVRRDV
jgi:hypothetical protein